MRNLQQTIETRGQKAEAHINPACSAVGQFLGMKDPIKGLKAMPLRYGENPRSWCSAYRALFHSSFWYPW
jgi:hypothetical protein